jgi:hypothetical protein
LDWRLQLKRPIEIPEVFPEESEWGVMTKSVYPSGRVHISHHGMPNILCFKEGDRNHLAWRVPIDDNQHASFQVDVQHVVASAAGCTRNATTREYIELKSSTSWRKRCCAAICGFRISRTNRTSTGSRTTSFRWDKARSMNDENASAIPTKSSSCSARSGSGRSKRSRMAKRQSTGNGRQGWRK